MRKEIKVALIGALAVTASAVIAGLFGLIPIWHKQDVLETERPNIQTTFGDQSPIVNTKGDVNINYGVPQAIVDRWKNRLNKFGMTEEKQNKELKRLSELQRNLQSALANRSTSDVYSKKALTYLSAGNYRQTEEILLNAIDLRINDNDYLRASERASDISRLKALQLEPLHAQSFMSLANNLRRKHKSLDNDNVDHRQLIDPLGGSSRLHNAVANQKPNFIASCTFPDKEVVDLFLLDKYREERIIVTYPNDLAILPKRACIKGVTSDPGANIWTIIQQRRSFSDWWVQPKVVVNEDGRWKGELYLGPMHLTQEEHRRKEYDIVAVVNPKMKLKEGERLRKLPSAESMLRLTVNGGM